MSDRAPSDEIAFLEGEIERLAAVRESCRKIILAGKVAVALGALLLIALAFGRVWVDQLALLGAVTAVLGGSVAVGSNTTTLREADEEIGALEARRSALIDALELPVVAERPDRRR